MTTTLTGNCLCGQVRFSSEGGAQMAAHCHCMDCRKASGAGRCTHVVVAEAGFMLTGPVRRFDKPADSGAIVTRVFCETCGSPICSMNERMPGMVFIRAGALDDPDAVTPGMTVYASRAPRWDRTDNTVPRFEVMPPDMPV